MCVLWWFFWLNEFFKFRNFLFKKKQGEKWEPKMKFLLLCDQLSTKGEKASHRFFVCKRKEIHDTHIHRQKKNKINYPQTKNKHTGNNANIWWWYKVRGNYPLINEQTEQDQSCVFTEVVVFACCRNIILLVIFCCVIWGARTIEKKKRRKKNEAWWDFTREWEEKETVK